MKGGGSRLNVNIHKPRSALIRIENKVLPSAAPPNRRPRPPAPARRRLLRFIHTPGMHRARRPPGLRRAGWAPPPPQTLSLPFRWGPGRGGGARCPPRRAGLPLRDGWRCGAQPACAGGGEGEGRAGAGWGCTWWPRAHGRAGGRPGQARPLPPREVAGGGKAGGREGACPAPYSRARPHAEWRGCSHAWLHLSRGNSCTCARPRSGRGNPNRKDASGKLAREGEREHPAPLPRRRFQLGVPPATNGSQVGAPGGPRWALAAATRGARSLPSGGLFPRQMCPSWSHH